jgi:hypothetical protein
MAGLVWLGLGLATHFFVLHTLGLLGLVWLGLGLGTHSFVLHTLGVWQVWFG